MGTAQARFWRRIYLGISLSLGVISPVICWYMIPDFNPITKPLSYSFVALCLTAIVSMDNLIVHRISAYSFFLGYNLFVFSFGFFRSSKYVRKGMFSMIVGSLMLLSSLLLLPFPSYGVFEIVYFLLLLFWNAHLFYKRVETENKALSKELINQETTSPVS